MSDELSNLEGFDQFLKPVDIGSGTQTGPAGAPSAELDELEKKSIGIIVHDMIPETDAAFADELTAAFGALSADIQRRIVADEVQSIALDKDGSLDYAIDAAYKAKSVSGVTDKAFSNLPKASETESKLAAKILNAYHKACQEYAANGKSSSDVIDDVNDIANSDDLSAYSDVIIELKEAMEQWAANIEYEEYESLMKAASQIKNNPPAGYNGPSGDILAAFAKAYGMMSGLDADDDELCDEPHESVKPLHLPDLSKRPNEKYKAIKAKPFTLRAFAEKFQFDLEDLDNAMNSYDASKFADFIPEGFDKFNRVAPVQCRFYDPDEDRLYVLMACRCSKDKYDWSGDVAFPAAFAIFMDESGQFKTYVPKAYNCVDDSGKPYTTDSVGLTNEYVDSANQMKPDLYAKMLCEGQYDERKMCATLDDVMYKNAWSVTKLGDVGELTASPVCKQYGDGYVFVGTVTLNKSEETREFFSDMEMKLPADKQIEFYLKVCDYHLNSNQLRDMKDIIEQKLSFEPDSYVMNRDLKGRGNIIYVECPIR